MLRFFCFTLVIFFYSEAFGQIYIGPKIGGQLSYTIFDDSDFNEVIDQSPLIGFNAGLVFAFEIKKRFYLQTEFLYSRKGKKYESEFDGLFEYVSFNHHIDVPILFKTDFKTSFGKGKVLRWYGNIGPNISYWMGGGGRLFNSEIEEFGFESPIDLKLKFDIPDDFDAAPNENVMVLNDANRFQLGLNIGGGTIYETPGGRWIMIDFRFEIGHTFIGSESGNRVFVENVGELIEFDDNLKSRNAGLRVSFAYLFNSKLDERLKGKSSSKGGKKRIKMNKKGGPGKKKKR